MFKTKILVPRKCLKGHAGERYPLQNAGCPCYSTGIACSLGTMEAFRSTEGWKPRVNVVVLKVTSPTCFSIREAPGLQMSQSGRDFACMESNMEQYMGKCETLSSSQPPAIGSIVLVRKQTDMEWYRARVDKIVDTTSSYQVEVTLVDYGQTLVAEREELRKVSSKKILQAPFQCIEFSLLRLRPLQRTINEATITVEHVPADSWDAATIEYVKSAVKKASSVQVQVLGQTVSGGLYGKLFIGCKKKVMSLDEELVSLNYAFLDPEADGDEILLEDEESMLGTSKSEQHTTTNTSDKDDKEETTSKSSTVEQALNKKNTLAVTPEVLDVRASSLCTEDIPAETPLAEVSLTSMCTTAASSPSEGLSSLTSMCQEPNVIDRTDVQAENLNTTVPTESHNIQSRIPTLARTPTESAKGLEVGKTVCSSSEVKLASGIDSHPNREVHIPGTKGEEHITTAPSKIMLSEFRSPCFQGLVSGLGKADDFLMRRSAGRGVILLQAKQPTSPILTQPWLSQPVHMQSKKPVQDCPPGFVSTGMGMGHNRSSRALSKAAKLWDLLQKKDRVPSETHLPIFKNTFKKPQSNDRLTGPVKSDEVTEETACHGGGDELVPTNANLPTTGSTSCISNTKSQPESEKTSDSTAHESIDYSDFMSPCHIVEEIVDPDLEEAKWNLKFDTEVPDLAAINVCQAPEDFRRHDFQSFAEVPLDLDPYTLFGDSAYFSADFDSCKLPAQLACSRVRAICHGIWARKPITNLDQTPFDATLKERLRSLGFRSPSCIQSVVWPAVLTGRNVVAVAPPHTGKTLAYLIPLVSRLATETDYDELRIGCGPLMLILTSTWQGAHRIYEQVNLLVEEDKSPKCCVLYAGGSEAGKEIPIINGCDILVATPHSFLRFLNNYNRLIVNLYRCCHLVLDDGERLLEKYTVEVTAVVNEFQQCQERRQSRLHLPQIIVCSTMWTSSLDWFLRMSLMHQTPLVILSSFSEAAVYAAVPTVICYVDPLSQNDALLKIVKDSVGRKVVVCAAERETAIAVHQLLTSHDLYSLLLHDELPVAKISEVSNEWTSKHPKVDMPILVIQDKVLPLTSIRDATVLVHYDIPKLSEFNFGFRYSCIADHMRSFIDKEDFYTSEGPVAHMILSSNNRSISVQLVEFLNRLGSNVPDGLVHLAAQEQMRVSSSTELPLCPNLKTIGRCERQSGENRCSYRHQILPGADHSPSWSHLPCQGNVRIAIMKVTSASHFYAQILQQWDVPSASTNENEPEVKENWELQEVMSLLREHSRPKKRVPLDEKAIPTVGQVYGLEAGADQFERVRVTSVSVSTTAPASVTVMHLDCGGQSTVSATRLFHLPPRLAMIRPLAVEVYCCNVQPPDNDLSWTFQADFKVHSLFFRKELVGKIVLRLGNTLWLEPLVLREKLRLVDAQVALQNVRSTLIKEGFACANPTHMDPLRKMAADAGVTVPPLFAETEGQSNIRNVMDTTVNKPCTTYLDTRDYNHVFLWKATSPSHFYVQPCRFNKCLDDLEKNIENAVQRQKLKKLKPVHVGALCIAHCSNNSWYRGEVQKILNDEEVVVFFHDYGDSEICRLNELLEPLSWMMQLPYQALLCSLAGIGPTSQEWSPKAQCVLEDFGYDNNNFNRVLCLRVARKIAGDQPGTSSYEVFLFDSCSSGRIGASDLLIIQKLAVPTELPQLNFDISLPHESEVRKDEALPQSESDDDDEWVTSDCKKRLGEHLFTVSAKFCDQVLAPVANEQETDCHGNYTAATDLLVQDPSHDSDTLEHIDGVCPSKAIPAVSAVSEACNEIVLGHENSECLSKAIPPASTQGHDGSAFENGECVCLSKTRSAAAQLIDHPELGGSALSLCLPTLTSAANDQPEWPHRHDDALKQRDTTCLSSARSTDVVPPKLHKCIDKKNVAKKKKATKVSWQDALKTGLQTLDSQFKTASSYQPTVLWWQDRNFVHVDIPVMNVTDYKLNLTATALCLRITTTERDFLVHEKLFAAIEPSQTSLTKKEKSLTVNLKKAKAELKWKFLTRHKRKMPHIRYNLDHVGMSDSDDDIIIASKAWKDPSFTVCERPQKVLPFDPVAHEERTMEIEAAKNMDDFFEEMYCNCDPNNIFEDLD
ncbi:uncharacterized protein LOC142571930 isoform X1 [Dermacentor variabilis]|uniref:uncharacterized protein LOC142571930 isoform X1 n=2 Tax=Dermacentor variabilis TaxID=34621 RepID=UPI003F5BCFD6